jgi:hypothetical protein
MVGSITRTLVVMLALAAFLSSARAGELKVEGGFDNAQVAGVRVEDAASESPRVIIAGTQAVEGMPQKARDVNRLIHWNIKLTGLGGRLIRFELYLDKASPYAMRTLVPTVYYGSPGEAGGIELVRAVEYKSYGPSASAKLEKSGVFFTHRFRQDTACISYSLPFNNDSIAALAKDLKANKFVTVHELGKTPIFQLPLNQFVVNDPCVPDKDKKGVWLYAGEDPWEFPGMWGLDGFLRFACSEDPLAAEFRRKFILSAIPHVNPDALHRGDTNFYMDEKGRDIINTGLSWKRTDIAANEMIKAAMRKWKEDGRSLDFMTTMHSSCFWAAVLRTDWAYDANAAKVFKDGVYSAKYIPWAAGQGMGTPADMSGTLGASLGAELWPDRLLFFAQHLEQIVMPKSKLLGMKLPQWPEGLPQEFLRCQQPDLLTQGELFARAVCEFYGVKVPAEKVPPFLMCGDVDRYGAAAGQPIHYTVLYRDVEGRAAKFVRMTVAGKTVEMTPIAGADPVKGILYDAAEKLAAGDNGFSFAASNGAIEIRYPKAGAFLGPRAEE